MSDSEQSGELRVLVVDDNVDAATALCYLLQSLDCKTAVAFDGVTGLQVAQLFLPALVFLDLDMPGPDGCEVVARARQLDGKVSRALFVCLSGRSEPEDKQRCLAAGFDRFISKPIELAALGELLLEARLRVGPPDALPASTTQRPS